MTTWNNLTAMAKIEVVVDGDDVRDRRRTERSEPDPEVEWRAEHDDEVRALLQQPACPQERQLVIGGQQAAPHPVEETGHALFRRLDDGAAGHRHDGHGQLRSHPARRPRHLPGRLDHRHYRRHRHLRPWMRSKRTLPESPDATG